MSAYKKNKVDKTFINVTSDDIMEAILKNIRTILKNKRLWLKGGKL